MIEKFEQNFTDILINQERNQEGPLFSFASNRIDNDFILSVPTLLSTLTPTEMLDLDKFQTEKRRLEWLAGRCAVKTAIRRLPYWKAEQRIEILRAPSGAPFVNAHVPIHISISHSGSLAVAVAAPFAIGIDIEQLEPRPESFVQMFFNEDERAHLERVPADLKTLVINRSWTYKEAVSKVLKKGGALNFKTICSLEKTCSIGLNEPLIYTQSSSTTRYVMTIAYQPKDNNSYGRN